MKVVAETVDFFADTPAEAEMRIFIRNALDKLVMEAFERETKGMFITGDGHVQGK